MWQTKSVCYLGGSMKIRMQEDKIVKTGVAYIEEFESCYTKFGKGKVQRVWLDEELIGYRVMAGYRKIWGDTCITLKDSIDAYERLETKVRQQIKKEMEG